MSRPPGTPAPSSLPSRPPASVMHTYSSNTTNPSHVPPSSSSAPFSGFRPRQVAAHPGAPSNPPPPSYAQLQQPAQYATQQYPGQYSGSYSHQAQSYNPPPNPNGAPHIVNPFPLPQQSYSRTGNSRYADLDPELQAQIAQQQSIYDPATRQNPSNSTSSSAAAPVPSSSSSKPDSSNSEYPTPSAAAAAAASKSSKNAPTVVRQGGGQTWTDPTLLEWDPSHFRLFVGNLAGEVTDDSLLKAFSKYPSVQKARVIRDKRTTKSKGYGFVAFSDGDEYFRAAREMQGKYIGSHPVLLKKSNTEIKPVVVGGGKKGAGVKDGRVEKKKKKKKGEQRNVLG